MEYIVDHININKYHRPGLKGDKATITVHNTAVPNAPAKNFRKNLGNPTNTRYASYHIVIDNKQAIECIPLDEVAYHAANTEGNTHSIGIEICEVEGANGAAAELIANMLKERGWGIDRVTTHKRWSGKYCPHLLLPVWDWFLNLIKSKMEDEGMLIVIPFGIPDMGAAQILASNKKGAVLDWGLVAANDDVIQVGGPKDFKPVKPCKSFKVISGSSREDTATKVCDEIRGGK